MSNKKPPKIIGVKIKKNIFSKFFDFNFWFYRLQKYQNHINSKLIRATDAIYGPESYYYQ